MYVDAEEMQKVLEATYRQQTAGSGLPGAEAAVGGIPTGLAGLATYDAGTEMEDDDIPRAPKSSKGGRIGKQVQSDESYYSGGSDDE